MKMSFVIIAAFAAMLMLAPASRADTRKGGGLPILGGSAGAGHAQPKSGSGKANAPVNTSHSNKVPTNDHK
jgi:uncharacterized membrane protein